jgi:hypothetical protein
MDTDQATDLERCVLAQEETGDIRALLAAARRLPDDTKAGVLLKVLRELRGQGRPRMPGIQARSSSISAVRRSRNARRMVRSSGVASASASRKLR